MALSFLLLDSIFTGLDAHSPTGTHYGLVNRLKRNVWTYSGNHIVLGVHTFTVL